MSEVLQTVRETSRSGTQTVGDIVEALGHASFAPLLLLPALVVVTPLSGIPGLSSVCGIAIALVAFQMLIGRRHLWLPQRLLHMRISRDLLKNIYRYLRYPTELIDRFTRRRLSALVRRPFSSLLYLLCMMCGLAMPFLEFVPFSSSILGAAVAVMAVALVNKDGIVALVSLGLMLSVALVPIVSL